MYRHIHICMYIKYVYNVSIYCMYIIYVYNVCIYKCMYRVYTCV